MLRVFVSLKYRNLREQEFNEFTEKHIKKIDTEQYREYRKKIETCSSCGSVNKKKKNYIGRNFFKEKEFQLICLLCNNVEDHTDTFNYKYYTDDLVRNIRQIVSNNYIFREGALREMRDEFIARRFEYECIQQFLEINREEFKWHRHSLKNVSTEQMEAYIKERKKW